MRRASRRDANHNILAGYFERLGCSVLDLSRVGAGCPDLLCAIRGNAALVEVKTATGMLEPAQVDFRRDWKGLCFVARNLDDVLSIVKELKASPKG